MKGLLSYVAFLLVFILTGYVHAQSTDTPPVLNPASGNLESYTQPSEHDLDLIANAVARCDILSEVAYSIDGDKLSSQEIFDKLQQTNEDGNLLIDTKQCEDSILKFVSSLCSSDESLNNLYCNRLGIKKVEEQKYKSFGESAFGNLDLNNRDDTYAVNNPGNREGTKFSVAQSLFLLTPVRGLKFARPVSRVLGDKIKPVLSGAMLILASLGLSACDDLSGHEQVCNSGLSGYFLLEKESSGGKDEYNCIKLPEVEFDFKDSSGTSISGTSNEPKEDVYIHINFDAHVSYLDEDGRGSALSKSIDLYNMIEITNEDNRNLVGQLILVDDFEVDYEGGKSHITVKPPQLLNGVYPAGSYKITSKNYAKAEDVPLIFASSNKDKYLSEVQEETVFFAGEPITPCTNGERGWFQLKGESGNKLSCIKLPRVSFKYINDGEASDYSDGSNDVVIDMVFDSEIAYFGRSGSGFVLEDLSIHRLLDMLVVRPLGGSNLVGDIIGVDDLSFGLTSGGNHYIRIMPPGEGYDEGNYEVSVENYAKLSDERLITNSSNSSRTRYLSLIKKHSVFYVGDPETPCTRGERGWFQLVDDDGRKIRCISLSVVSFSYTNDGTTSSSSDGSSDVVIDVVFDSEVLYLGGVSGGSNDFVLEDLSIHRLLDMLVVRPLGGGNLVGNTIGVANLSFGLTDDDNHYIRIMPPSGGYEEGNYEVSVENYARLEEGNLIANSVNRTRYLSVSRKYSVFYVGNPETPCTRGEEGWFQLEDASGNSLRCIELSEVSFQYTSDGVTSDDSDGSDDVVIDIVFDSEIAYFGRNTTGGGTFIWEELSIHRLLDMVKIGPVGGGNLVGDTIGVANLSFGLTSGGNTYIRVMPPSGGYDENDYEISIENYAKLSDANSILNSEGTGDSSRTRYLSLIKKHSVFYVENPETPCTRGESGYFQLRKDGQDAECIKLSAVDVSYDSFNGADDVVITVGFDSRVAHIEGDGDFEGLSNNHLLEMLEISRVNGGGNLIGDSIGLEQLSVEVVSGSHRIKIEPPVGGYLDGDYAVSIEGYVRDSDAQAVSVSDNRDDYLQKATRTSAFYVGTRNTPCARGEAGYFQLRRDGQDAGCIELSVVDVSYSSSNGADDVVITVDFDSTVSYLDDNGDFEQVSNNHLLDMLEISGVNGGSNLIGDSIGLEQLSVEVVSGNHRIKIEPPVGGYLDGDYSVEIEGYVRDLDVQAVSVSDNRGDYLQRATKTSAFYVGTRNTPCARGESGYFQLKRDGQDAECIELSVVDVSYSSSNGADDVVITVDFDSKVSHIDDDGDFEILSNNHLLDMLEISSVNGGSNLIGDSIGLEQLSVEVVSGNHRIKIEPPVGGYLDGDYSVEIEGYVRDSDAQAVSVSDNRSDYLQRATRTSAFYVGTRNTPCARGELGYFQLRKDGQNAECIKLPTPTFEFTTSDGQNISREAGRAFVVPRDAVLTIRFNGEIAYIVEQGWETLSLQRVFDMVDIRQIDECDSDSAQDYTDCTTGRNKMGTEYTIDKITVGVDANGSYIIIEPPDNGLSATSEIEYECIARDEDGNPLLDENGNPILETCTKTITGDHVVELENYVFKSDAPDAYRADNLVDGYLPTVATHIIFHLEEDACDAGSSGVFTVIDDVGDKVGCIGIPTAAISFKDDSDDSIISRSGSNIEYIVPKDHTIEILFDGIVGYVDPEETISSGNYFNKRISESEVAKVVELVEVDCDTNDDGTNDVTNYEECEPIDDNADGVGDNLLGNPIADGNGEITVEIYVDRDLADGLYKSQIRIQDQDHYVCSNAIYRIKLRNYFYSKDYSHLEDIVSIVSSEGNSIGNMEGEYGYLGEIDDQQNYYRTHIYEDTNTGQCVESSGS